PGMRAKTSNGPVRSSCVIRGNITIAIRQGEEGAACISVSEWSVSEDHTGIPPARYYRRARRRHRNFIVSSSFFHYRRARCDCAPPDPQLVEKEYRYASYEHRTATDPSPARA